MSMDEAWITRFTMMGPSTATGEMVGVPIVVVRMNPPSSFGQQVLTHFVEVGWEKATAPVIDGVLAGAYTAQRGGQIVHDHQSVTVQVDLNGALQALYQGPMPQASNSLRDDVWDLLAGEFEEVRLFVAIGPEEISHEAALDQAADAGACVGTWARYRRIKD